MSNYALTKLLPGALNLIECTTNNRDTLVYMNSFKVKCKKLMLN